MGPILRLTTLFKCKNNMYIPLKYNSAANRLKKDSVVYPLSVGITIKNQCATLPTRIGFSAPERLRVQYDRTVTSKGCEQPNGLGLRATERLTNINKDLT